MNYPALLASLHSPPKGRESLPSNLDKNNVDKWSERGLDLGPIVDRICSDIRSIGGLEDSITDEQKNELKNHINETKAK